MIRSSNSRSGLLKQWLLHALVIWTVVTIIDTLNFMLKVRDGMQLVYPDGTIATFLEPIADRNSGNDVIWLPVLLITFLVELNYHFLFKSKKLKVFMLTTSLSCGLSYAADDTRPAGGRSFCPRTGSWAVIGTLIFFTSIFSLYAFFTLLPAIIFTPGFKAEQQLRHSQAELAALKAQINPHFFFNTLNNIYGTALEENAGRTAQFIERLSGLMRYVIHSSQNDLTSCAAGDQVCERIPGAAAHPQQYA